MKFRSGSLIYVGATSDGAAHGILVCLNGEWRVFWADTGFGQWKSSDITKVEKNFETKLWKLESY